MFNVKRILCPTDFSEYSKCALRYAAFLAKMSKATITVLHANEFRLVPLAYSIVESDPSALEEYNNKIFLLAQERFAEMVQDLPVEPSRISTVLQQGRAFKVIIEEAEQGKHDLIVMATRGTTESKAILIGTTAERVVRLARTPVLTLKKLHSIDKLEFQRILFPTDFSVCANAALPYALALARQFAAKLYMLHVEVMHVTRPESPPHRFPNPLDYDKDASDVEVEQVLDGDIEPGNAIVRFAENRDVDLIVMSTHGSRGLRRAFFGSNTAEVARRAACPVLIITPPLHAIAFPTTV
jgi:nucleotide-binding universal stress UspA family protein